MELEHLTADPGYRLGVITGRLQTLGELVKFFIPTMAAKEDFEGRLYDLMRTHTAIRDWMEQVEAECDAESVLLQEDLGRAEQ